MKEHTAVCSECEKEFTLESAKWCDHYINLGIGSLLCPYCNTCICHGENKDQIIQRFDSNIQKGKFIKCSKNIFGWDYMCKTVKEVEV